jgi:hypothetical protein
VYYYEIKTIILRTTSSSLFHRGHKTRIVLLEEGLVDNTDVGVVEHLSLVEPMVHRELVFEHAFSHFSLFGGVT